MISEKELERRRKISETLKRKYANKEIKIRERTKEEIEKSINSMREANLKRYAEMSLEEKQKITKNANVKNTGSKRNNISKKRMSDANKEYFLNNKEEHNKRYEKVFETLRNKTVEEKEIIRKKRSESLKKSWDKNKEDEEWMLSRSSKIKEKALGVKRSEGSIQKQKEKLIGRKLSDEHKKAISDGGQISIKNGVIKSGWYEIFGKYVQGKSELLFISRRKELVENGKIIFHPKSIKTPYGYYRPDFEIDGVIYEIKSSFTFRQLFMVDFSNEERVDKIQLKKMIWISKNVKPINIIIVDRDKKYEKVYLVDEKLNIDSDSKLISLIDNI